MKKIIDDLIAEQVSVDWLVDNLDEIQWELPVCCCKNWSVKDTMIHIAFLDYAVNLILTGETCELSSILKLGKLDAYARVTAYENLSKEEIMRWWRIERHKMINNLSTSNPKKRIVWMPENSMSIRSLATARLMELWAHSIDIYDMLNIVPIVTDRIKNILFLSYQARKHSYKINNLSLPKQPIYLQLTLPSGKIWNIGEPQNENYIKGSAEEWALVSVRRRNWKNTHLIVVGDIAKQFATIVQTYAGNADPAPEIKQ